jgi:hypothetical protein
MTANGRESVFANVIGPRFSLGITLVSRTTNEDAATAPPVAIVSDAFVRKQFPGETRSASAERPRAARPVARDRRRRRRQQMRAERTPAPIVYLPLSQNHESGMVLFVQATGSAETLRPGAPGDSETRTQSARAAGSR